MAVERTADQIARDAGFREGALWAASLARDVLKGMTPEAEPGGFNGRSYRSAERALQALAEGIERGVGDPPAAQAAPPTPVPPTPPPLTPMLGIGSALAAVVREKRALSDHATDAAGIAPDRAEAILHSQIAIAKDYTGDECRDCGSFSMVRNGMCLKCENCGSTTGCS